MFDKWVGGPDPLDVAIDMTRQGARILFVCRDMRHAQEARVRILMAFPDACEAPHRAILAFGLGSIQLVANEFDAHPFDASDRIVVFHTNFTPADHWLAFVDKRVLKI